MEPIQPITIFDDYTVNPLLTDLYELTMAYRYWKAGLADNHAVFELFFRKHPFKGEFTICAGIQELLQYLNRFKFTKEHLDYLRTIFPGVEEGFFEYLAKLDCSKLNVYAMPEARLVFPKEPILSVEGPLLLCQILETTLINLTSYPCLICTNAARMRIAAGREKTMIEFGLRRAQGPIGGTMGAKYSVLGTFDGTSNVLLGCLSKGEIKVYGTMAHSFVVAYHEGSDLGELKMMKGINILEKAEHYRTELGWTNTNKGEMLSFLAYMSCNPEGFLALVDTYNTLNSGVKNFLVCALVLDDLGLKARGIRLDSGDLAVLSKNVRNMFKLVAEKYKKPYFEKFVIFASNEIHEDILYELKEQGHEIDAFGIGTNLITCLKQPSLGMVYKLVSISGLPRLKLSDDIDKATLPGSKSVYRLYLTDPMKPSCDLIATRDEPAPVIDKELEVRDMQNAAAIVKITPKKVELMNSLAYDKSQPEKSKKILVKPQSVNEGKKMVYQQIDTFNPAMFTKDKPQAYKVYLSVGLYNLLDTLTKAATV